MADTLDDAEFWLPSQFLSDDDWLLEKEYMKTVTNGDGNIQKGFTKDVFGVPYNFPSDLSSPVESASTETESDEDDYSFLAGLTHQMAHSTLLADDLSFLGQENPKGWSSSKPVSRSPQSTLCQVGRGCGCKPATGREPTSTNGHSNTKACSASSPQATWELLYAAAGEVAKMKLDEEAASYGSHVCSGDFLMGPTRNHIVPNRDHKTTLSAPEIALYHKLQALQFQQLKQQQQLLLKQRQQQGVAWGEANNRGGPHLHQHYHNGDQSYRGRCINGGNAASGGLGLRPAWPPLSQAQPQQHKQAENGMRAVYLPAKRERSGTGVFLPRRVGTPASDTRKKSAGSTVLLPARVVQAMNLNLDDVSGPQQLHPRFPGDNDTGDLRLRSGDFLGGFHGKRSFRSQVPVISSEVGLPQEWTY